MFDDYYSTYNTIRDKINKNIKNPNQKVNSKKGDGTIVFQQDRPDKQLRLKYDKV